MVNYRIEIKRSATKELKKLPKNDLTQIIVNIQLLASNPRPYGAKKLVGQEGYRIRHGDYRILYTIKDNLLIVTVVKVAHRRESYR